MFTAYVCPQCGGKLEKAEDNKYKCKFCSTLFEESKAEQFADVLNKFLDNEKQEKLANLKNLLWVELHEKKYIDSERILELTKDIMKIYPEDYIAGFFYTANNNEIASTADKIAKFDVRNYGYAVDWVLDFIIKSLEPSYVLPTSDLIERAFKNDDEKHKKYTSLLSQEAEKVEDGIYNLNMPRDVFVCYSSADMPKVVELVSTLEEEGISCFVAARNLRHGAGAVQNYQSALETAIEYCKIIVFVSGNNSRKLSCDAIKFELPYIRRRDLDKAPAEYAHDYEKMPAFFKKPRIEYLVDRYADRLSATDKQVKEFFSGNEWCLYSEDVRDRVVDILTNGWAKPVEVKDEAQNAFAEEFARKLAEQQEKAKKEQEELAQQLREMKEQLAKQSSGATFPQKNEKSVLLESILQKEAAEKAKKEAEEKAKREEEEREKRKAEEKARREAEEKARCRLAQEKKLKADAEKKAYFEKELQTFKSELNKKNEEIDKLKLAIEERESKISAEEADKDYIENELKLRRSKFIKTQKIKAEIEEYSIQLANKTIEMEKLFGPFNKLKSELGSKKIEKEEFIRKKIDLRIKNDVIFFGFYPQSEVKDETVKTALNNLAGAFPTPKYPQLWTPYDYYIESKKENYMWYIDVDYNEKKYRGVYFIKYRQFVTTEINERHISQNKNGYTLNIIYWFAYEPIKWRIIQQNNGKALILSEMVIDSQQYCHFTTEKLFEHNGGNGYSSDYALSDIRRWLNDTFYNTAFNPLQNEVIKSTNLNNIQDKVFLISKQELVTSEREQQKKLMISKKSTDYACCQGSDNNKGFLEYARWWLRGSNNSDQAPYIHSYMDDNKFLTHATFIGVVPAMTIELP